MENQIVESFRFGFVMYHQNANPNLEQINGWETIKSQGYQLHVHPEANVTTVETREGFAVLIGDAFTTNREWEVDDILSTMLEEDGWDVLDYLSGRFALFLFTPSSVKVIHDPLASRSVFYRESGDCCVGSHAALIASLFHESLCERTQQFTKLPEYKSRGTVYLPGDLTMYANIKGLVPNNYYELRTKQTFRYWPRKPVPAATVQSLITQSEEYFFNMANMLNANYRVLMGLTGGVDARAIIAGLNKNKVNLRFVTWTGNRLPEKEYDVVKTMIEHHNKPHVFLEPKTLSDDLRFKQMMRAANTATGYSRGNSRLTGNMSLIVQNGEVFIFGFGGEIIKGFYNRHKSPMTGDMLEDFYRLYKTRKVKEPSVEFHDFVMEATEGFLRRANYHTNTYNIDLRDLFYWEQRMSVWGANLLNEMDPAIYSLSGINSRQIFEMAFGIPEEERFQKKVMLNMTAHFDDALAQINTVS